MGQAVFSNNSTIKVKGKVSAGYTVAAGEYVVATYRALNGSVGFMPAFNVFYAPTDSVLAVVTTAFNDQALLAAVCFVNTP